MPEHAPLDERFRRHLRALEAGVRPVRLLVALSGGRDSVTLCYLLRFCAAPLPITISAAHLDHAMRTGSGDDALWVRGLCAAWGVPLLVERLAGAPGSEAEARRARYGFLRRAAARLGAEEIVTAHHADDQAETVLFRLVRGTGLAGLAGIRPRAGGLLRPLLPFRGDEIEEFARARGLRWRDDPTNRSLDPARNRLRHEVIPLLERAVASGTRRNLVSLAEIAGEAEAALGARAERAARRLVTPREGGFLLARTGLRDYDSATGTRVLRDILRRFGVVLTSSGTRRALAFITGSPSGRELQLPGGVRIRLEFDTAWIGTSDDHPDDQTLSIPGPVRGGMGHGLVVLAGARYRIEHGCAPGAGASRPAGEGSSVDLPLGALRFPLELRAWRPGDRIRTPGGTKTLKKLFVERRVPRSLRRRVPVLQDATGRVLWVAGVAGAPLPAPEADEETYFLTALND